MFLYLKFNHQIVYILENNTLISGCLFNIRKKDNVCVIYDIAVHPSYRNKSVLKEMISYLNFKFKCNYIFLKCISSNPSCLIFEHIGFKNIKQEQSKRSILNCYLLENKIRGGLNEFFIR